MSASKQEERKKEKRNLTFKDLYEQGSKCCQQYSALTMQIRTLAQYIMIAYTVGISLAISRASSPNPEMPTLVYVPRGFLISYLACDASVSQTNRAGV
jgi:hypothetical protein